MMRAYGFLDAEIGKENAFVASARSSFMTPRLVGFLSEIEREFFELFCSVDGVGVKKALRAMVRPVKEVATAIEEQDATTLSSLP